MIAIFKYKLIIIEAIIVLPKPTTSAKRIHCISSTFHILQLPLRTDMLISYSYQAEQIICRVIFYTISKYSINSFIYNSNGVKFSLRKVSSFKLEISTGKISIASFHKYSNSSDANFISS